MISPAGPALLTIIALLRCILLQQRKSTPASATTAEWRNHEAIVSLITPPVMDSDALSVEPTPGAVLPAGLGNPRKEGGDRELRPFLACKPQLPLARRLGARARDPDAFSRRRSLL